MNTLEESFTKLLGMQPTEEKQGLYRVRDALNLGNNDAVWLLLMALGHYETLYGKFPGLITDAARATLSDVKTTADAQMKASAEATKRDLAAAVAHTAEQVARHTATRGMLKWAAGCLAVAAVALTIPPLLAHRYAKASGYSHGWAEGYRSAVDEKAAAAWANTPDGQLAYGLAKAGSIRDLATCSGRGWVKKGSICYPRSENGSMYGWVLPSDPRRGR